jgi:hypothetical protein
MNLNLAESLIFLQEIFLFYQETFPNFIKREINHANRKKNRKYFTEIPGMV